MKTGKHTPGPWEAEWPTRTGYHETGKKGLYVWDGNDQEPVICEVPDDERADGSSRIANARLIAAAPRLLAALESAADLIASCQRHGCPAGPIAIPSEIADALTAARG